MEAELSRAKNELKAEGYPSPYYVSLTAIDLETWELKCSLGGRLGALRARQRFVTPDLRVGDYSLDNHPTGPSSGFVARQLPFDDDELGLRHELWRLLDGAYKSAVAEFLRKQALRVARGKAEYDTDDLSRESVKVWRAEPPAMPWDYARLESLCQDAARAFGRKPALQTEASFRARHQWSRFRDTEGRKVDFPRSSLEISLDMVDMAADGMRLFANRRLVFRTPEAMPSGEDLQRLVGDMSRDLELLRLAKTTSPFSAPALIDPSVAAAVVLGVALRLSGEEQRNPGGSQVFRGKLGRLVLPEELSLIDDPTRSRFQGVELAGHYDWDDQGLPPRPATLIERGVLQGLLLSRYPVLGFPRSNGHGRSMAGYWPEGLPGNLFLRSEKPAPVSSLLERLRQECRRRGKPYGLWVRQLRHFTQQQGTEGHGSIRLVPGQVYLVEAQTGRTILVRDLDLVGTPLDLMDSILTAGDDPAVQNLVLGAPMSVISPSLLLDDAELQRSEMRPERPPILSAPAR